MTVEHLKILTRLVNKYGDQQINICIEEMSELTKELCKHNRGKTNTLSIKEELADVYIMLYQMQVLFEIDTAEINEVIDFKINRTKERLLDE